MAGVYGPTPRPSGGELRAPWIVHTAGVIVTIVRFPPTDEAIGVEEARARFGTNATSYLETPGLLWKAYLRSDDGRSVGGVYWWRDRASAEARFTEGWREGVTAKYGAPPRIEWFDAPVVVDNRTDSVHTVAPPS